MSNYIRTSEDVAREHPAAVSAVKMLLERYEGAACDSPAVSTCVRCNTVFLSRWITDAIATGHLTAVHGNKADSKEANRQEGSDR